MESNLEPAWTVCQKLGGFKKTAEICGLRSKSSPSRWPKPVETGGGGGIIPGRHHKAILAYARANGIALAPVELIEAITAKPQGEAA